MTVRAAPVSPAPGRAPGEAAPGRSWRRRASSWWPAAWGAVLGAALFALAYRAMPDDALISLSFARNLAEHGQWALTTGIEANTATSPLNIALLAGLSVLTGGHVYWAAAALLCGCLVLGALWLRRLGGAAAGLLGPAVMATSPILASSVGLETVLAVTVLIGVVRYAVARRWVLAGIGVGAAWLTRPDLLLPAVVAVAVLALALRCARLLLALPLGALVAAPWVLFSWRHFGSPWPSSATVKWANGAWGGPEAVLGNPAYFFGGWPQVATVAAAGLVAGACAVVVAAARRWWAPAALGAAGAAHLAALSAATTPPIFYYLGPSTTCLALALTLVACRWRWTLVLPAALVAASVLVLAGNGAQWARGFAPIRQNWASDAEYAAIAARLPTDGPVLGGEIGALAFSCQDQHPACTVVDPVLADPGRTDPLVEKWRAEHPGIARLAFRYYHPPPPVPVRHRLDLALTAPPADGGLPMSPGPSSTLWTQVVPASDPLQMHNP